MKIKTLLSLFLIIIISSCNFNNEKVNIDILGTWIPSKYSDSLIVVNRSDELDNDKQGFTFKKNGDMIERKTIEIVKDEPAAYWDFDGSWEISDSLIHIKIDHWDGVTESTWKLEQLSTNSIAFMKINSSK